MSSAGGGPAARVRVDQFVPALLPGDAVGHHTLETHRALQTAGVAAGIWALTVDPELADRARPCSDFGREGGGGGGGGSLLLYQAASDSAGIVPMLLDRPEAKAISYHNITPASYFEPFDAATAAGLRAAAREVRDLVPRVAVALAASEFNAAGLREMGADPVHVVPPYLGPALRAGPDPARLAALDALGPGTRLLFVGRVAPNKGHEHLVRLLAAMRGSIDAAATLWLVGPPGPPLYMGALQRLIDRLAPGAVHLVGPVSAGELAAYYRRADVFVCMSDHEGFGIPLVEAMRMELPVVAYDAGAVAETLGGAGVLVRTREPTFLAELVARVAGDAELRRELCRRQLQRAAELEGFPRDERLVEILTHAALGGR